MSASSCRDPRFPAGRDRHGRRVSLNPEASFLRTECSWSHSTCCPSALLAPDPDLIIIRGENISLPDFDPLAFIQPVQHCGVRMVGYLRRTSGGAGFSQADRDLRDQMSHLVFKSVEVLDQAEMRVGGPGGDQAVIQSRRLFGRLGPRTALLAVP